MTRSNVFQYQTQIKSRCIAGCKNCGHTNQNQYPASQREFCYFSKWVNEATESQQGTWAPAKGRVHGSWLWSCKLIPSPGSGTDLCSCIGPYYWPCSWSILPSHMHLPHHTIPAVHTALNPPWGTGPRWLRGMQLPWPTQTCTHTRVWTPKVRRERLKLHRGKWVSLERKVGWTRSWRRGKGK